MTNEIINTLKSVRACGFEVNYSVYWMGSLLHADDWMSLASSLPPSMDAKKRITINNFIRRQEKINRVYIERISSGPHSKVKITEVGEDALSDYGFTPTQANNYQAVTERHGLKTIAAVIILLYMHQCSKPSLTTEIISGIEAAHGFRIDRHMLGRLAGERIAGNTTTGIYIERAAPNCKRSKGKLFLNAEGHKLAEELITSLSYKASKLPLQEKAA